MKESKGVLDIIDHKLLYKGIVGYNARFLCEIYIRTDEIKSLKMGNNLTSGRLEKN